MVMTEESGFLVVLALDPEAGPGAYAGVDRVPPYYIDDTSENRAAMDFYVLGDCKDKQTNLIPSFEIARRLMAELSRGGRQHEVILCCSGPESKVVASFPKADVEGLGYDVAGIRGDYWSIVGDFSASPWAEPLKRRLNEHGLFSDKNDAERYLRQYKALTEPDSDAAFDVIYVARVRSEADG